MKNRIYFIIQIFYFLQVVFCSSLFTIPLTLAQNLESSQIVVESEFLTSADEVFKEISQIRELEIRQPIRKGFKSREELRTFVLEKLEEEYTDQEIASQTKALIKLGLLPRGTQLKELLVNLLTEQIAGLYDPKEKIFYIADWMPELLQKPIMAHELTHALQDQYVDLEKFLKSGKKNDDETLARTAIVEGEALAVMVEYLLKPQGLDFSSLPDLVSLLEGQISILGGFGTDNQIPEVIKETLIFPYLHGISFVQTFRKSHPWKEFLKLYQDPPTSSEQILHPAKYFDTRDHPVTVEIDAFSDLFSRNWEEIDTNVLGELLISLVVKQFAEEEIARLAGEGWGGDQYKLFEARTVGVDENPENLLFLHFSTWDSPKDAMEFFLAYRQVIENKYTSEQLLQSEKRKNYLWTTLGGEVYLEVQGRDVIIIESAPRSLLPEIKRRLWASRKQ